MLAAVTGLLASGGAQAACTPKHKFPTIVTGELTVAVSVYAPYDTMNSDGSPGGVDGDLVKKIAAMECLKVNASAVASAAAITSVITGRADITTGDWYRTTARAKVVGLTGPIFSDTTAIYSKAGLATVQDLVGKQVGTVTGFLYVEDLRKLVGSGLHLYPNAVELQQDVTAGRIDAAIDSYSTGVIAKQNGGLAGVQLKVPPADPRAPSMAPAQSTFPYDKEDTALGAALDADILALRADGTIAAILKAHGLDPAAANPGPPTLL
jgi:polar amino acid transport system substrate-binding protein